MSKTPRVESCDSLGAEALLLCAKGTLSIMITIGVKSFDHGPSAYRIGSLAARRAPCNLLIILSTSIHTKIDNTHKH